MGASTFTVRNDPFVCVVCGTENPPAPKTCRDHCRACLVSLHVDKNPGDRLETCRGILVPEALDMVGGEMKSIFFRCQKCGKAHKNLIAEDDNREKLLELAKKPAFVQKNGLNKPKN